jgi:exopolysaccharide production protein ExoZ
MEGLRAYAVALVFCVHFFDVYFAQFRGIDFDSFHVRESESVFELISYYFRSSHYGVDLFFLLSGFLIFRIVSGNDFTYLGFLRNRLVRLYPAFAFALVLHLVYAAYCWNVTFDILTIVQNMFFLIGIWELEIKPIIVPAWSLSYEWLFYLAFPVLMLCIARGRPFSIWHIVFCAAVVLAAISSVDPSYVRFLMFFVGAGLACIPREAVNRSMQWIPDAAVLTLVAITNLVFVVDQNYTHFIWIYAVTSTLLVAKAMYGQGFLNKVFCLGPMRTLGNLSYSFFLLHGLAVIIVVGHAGDLITSIGEPLRIILLSVGSFFLAIVGAAFSYLLFERPYFNRRARTANQAEVAPHRTLACDASRIPTLNTQVLRAGR